MTATKVHRYEDKTPGAWAEFIAAMHSAEPFECDDEMYYYWLEVLPPVYMGRTVKLANGETRRVHFGFAEGADVITAFWQQGDRYFGCRTNDINDA